MNKTLATSVWLVLATLSPAALALGLGHATTLSPLQAPLDATVDLLESDGYRVEDIRASVAEPFAFSALGLEWSPLLSNLEVTPVRQNGRTFLRLSSPQAVSAPWLDVLITLDTPAGRQTQAVTLLFDPVDYLPGQPGAEVADVRQTAAPAPAPSPPPSRSAPPASAQPDATHTTVQPGDTLWDIALRTRAPGVDVQQMIAALAEANPAAFAGESIDSLRVGQRLRLPSREEALGRSPQQAARAVSARSGESPARGAASPEPQNQAVAQAPAAPRAAEPSGGESSEQGSAREPSPPAGEEADVEAAVLDALMASLSLEAALAAGEAETPAIPLLADSGVAPTAVVSQALAPFSPLPTAEAAPNGGEYQALLDEQARQAAEIDTLREEVAALRQTLGDVQTLALAQTGPVSASTQPSAPAPGVWASLRERWVWLAGIALLLLLAAMVISRKRRERQWEAAPLPVTPVAPAASAAPPSHTVPAAAASSPVATPPVDETPEPQMPESPGPQTLAVERRALAEQDLMEPAPWAPNDAPGEPDEPESAGAFSEALEPVEQDEPALAPKAPDSSSNHLIDYPPARATAPEDIDAKPLSQDVGATEPPSSTEPQWEIEEVAFKPRRRDNS
ncbi:FimV/HubP family polar landmark protein [Vreelandella sp. GE22]